MASSLHVSISAEPIFYIGDFAVTNSMFTSTIVSLLIIIFAIYASTKIKNTKRPQGLQNVLEFIIEGLLNLTNDITQSKAKTKILFPLTTTFFIFILLNNWSGLVPGVGTIGILEPAHISTDMNISSSAYASEEVVEVEQISADHSSAQDVNTTEAEDEHSQTAAEHGDTKKVHQLTYTPIFRAGTADLNTTLALALISVVFTQVIGLKYLGASYLTKFFNFKNPIFFFVGILELISELAKIISFAFRLFGNIFAGEVLLVVIAFLIPLLAPIPFIGLEIFVGMIQALVFTMLSLVFMSMATQAHGDDH